MKFVYFMIYNIKCKLLFSCYSKVNKKTLKYKQ